LRKGVRKRRKAIKGRIMSERLNGKIKGMRERKRRKIKKIREPR
jgi:hypothetical protein